MAATNSPDHINETIHKEEVEDVKHEVIEEVVSEVEQLESENDKCKDNKDIEQEQREDVIHESEQVENGNDNCQDKKNEEDAIQKVEQQLNNDNSHENNEEDALQKVEQQLKNENAHSHENNEEDVIQKVELWQKDENADWHENNEVVVIHEVEKQGNGKDDSRAKNEEVIIHEVEEQGNENDDSRDNDRRGEFATVSTQQSPAPIHTNIRKKKGGWRWAFFILVNQGLATLAFFGVGVNLVLFLTRVLRQENADAANNVSIWTGTVYLFSLVGAFLSDSYWGRYLTCTVFQFILVAGLILLSLTSWLMLLKPLGCGDDKLECYETSLAGRLIFYLAIYLVAFGYGGHQPTLATFGADQFDDDDDSSLQGEASASKSKSAFFSYFYFALNCGSLFSNTVLVYFEDKGYWTLGFWVSTGSAILALILFLCGSPRYRFVTAHGNPLPRVAQVFVATVKKWHVKPGNEDELYELQGTGSAIKGTRKIVHTNNFRCLDKAATITNKDLTEPENPWSLCTVTQVEEAKCVLKMLPIWLCTIIYSVIFTQMASLFVEQGDVMDNQFGNFHFPAASMSSFDICSVLVFTGIYRHILIPLAGKISRNPKGISELQRMGVGLVIGTFAMAAAGLTEIERLKRVVEGQKRSSLSVFWQVPQYVLVGASEVFMYVGQLEFFNGQAPDGIKSFGSALCMASISFGNYVSSLLVRVVMWITARGGETGWISSDLNVGHIDRFYFLIVGLTIVDVALFTICAKWYKPITFVQSGQNLGMELGLETNDEGEVVRRV